MYTVHGMSLSGNCHKVRMMLTLLKLPFKWREVDVLGGETRTPEFLRLNPNGRVPVLELDEGHCLPESNAILCYLAKDTKYWPDEALANAQTLQWMFFEQYSHEPFIAVARFINRFLPADHVRRAELDALHERGYRALDVMEQHLSTHPCFAAGRVTIADIALYAYTHCAADGGFDLARYGAVRGWLDTLQSRDGLFPMEPA